jgi:hypothetical protein
MTRIGCNLILQGRQLLGLVFDHTLSVLKHVTQKWRTLWSRCYPSFNAPYPFIFGQRGVPKGAFQSVTPQVKACLVEQDRSPPEPSRVVICPEGDLKGGRGATHLRLLTEPNAEREHGQRFDHRHPTTVEDGVYPVAA